MRRFFDNLRRLSGNELKTLASYCGGAALLVGIALVLSSPGVQLPTLGGASQAAATALGNTQNVPSPIPQDPNLDNTPDISYGYPANLVCYAESKSQHDQWGTGKKPLCPGNTGLKSGSGTWGDAIGDSDTFATGIFSFDLGGGSGKSMYDTRTYTQGGNQQIDEGSGCVTSCDQYNNCTTSCSCPSGQTLMGSECYKIVSVPTTLSAPTDHTDTTGSFSTTLSAGTPVTLEWSCLPSRQVNRENCNSSGCTTNLVYSYSFATTYTLTGPGGLSGSGSCSNGGNPSTDPCVGSLPTALPSTAGSYTYTLTCNGGTNAMAIGVTVVPAPPSVTTSAASSITFTGATLNGSVTAVNGANPTQHGFAYSTDSALKTGVSTSTLGSFVTGSFNSNLSGLTQGTTYYFRAYATNSAGTGYGSILSFSTVPDICTDISGNQNPTPTGCQTPSPSPGACIPGAKAYDSGSNTCLYTCPAALGGGATSTYPDTYPDCTCNVSGDVYQSANNACIVPSGSVSKQLQATPNRVRSGGSTSLSWSTSGMTSCSVKDETGATVSTATSSASTVVSNITHIKTFTLSCADNVKNYTNTASVTLVPTFQEI